MWQDGASAEAKGWRRVGACPPLGFYLVRSGIAAVHLGAPAALARRGKLPPRRSAADVLISVCDVAQVAGPCGKTAQARRLRAGGGLGSNEGCGYLLGSSTTGSSTTDCSTASGGTASYCTTSCGTAGHPTTGHCTAGHHTVGCCPAGRCTAAPLDAAPATTQRAKRRWDAEKGPQLRQYTKHRRRGGNVETCLCPQCGVDMLGPESGKCRCRH